MKKRCFIENVKSETIIKQLAASFEEYFKMFFIFNITKRPSLDSTSKVLALYIWTYLMNYKQNQSGEFK